MGKQKIIKGDHILENNIENLGSFFEEKVPLGKTYSSIRRRKIV